MPPLQNLYYLRTILILEGSYIYWEYLKQQEQQQVEQQQQQERRNSFHCFSGTMFHNLCPWNKAISFLLPSRKPHYAINETWENENHLRCPSPEHIMSLRKHPHWRVWFFHWKFACLIGSALLPCQLPEMVSLPFIHILPNGWTTPCPPSHSNRFGNCCRL